MVKPDICTSLICHPPQEYCKECSHAIFFGEGEDKKGKIWKWEFRSYGGPLFLRKDGEPLVNQPTEDDHPAWEPFEKWFKKHNQPIQATPNPTACTGEADKQVG